MLECLYMPVILFFDCIPVRDEANAGTSIRKVQRSVTIIEALLEELTGQVKVLNREFLIEEVRSQRINHRTGHCRNRPAAIMRGELKA